MKQINAITLMTEQAMKLSLSMSVSRSLLTANALAERLVFGQQLAVDLLQRLLRLPHAPHFSCVCLCACVKKEDGSLTRPGITFCYHTLRSHGYQHSPGAGTGSVDLAPVAACRGASCPAVQSESVCGAVTFNALAVIKDVKSRGTQKNPANPEVL